MVCPSRSINPSKGVLYLGFMDLEVEVCSHTQLAVTMLPGEIMNALPCRATMLPRCQAAKTALHINNEELLTPKEVFSCEKCRSVCRHFGEFLRVQANSPAHPSRELDEPSRRALRTAQELAGAGLRNAALPLHDSHSHAPAAFPTVVGISEQTPTRECGREDDRTQVLTS